MALLIATPDRDQTELAGHIRQLDPAVDVRLWPELGDAHEIEFALVWKQPDGLFERLPGLKAVTSLGAGVEAILNDPALPRDLAVGRLAGPRLAANMAAYLAAMVVNRWKNLPGFAADQRNRRWNQWAPEHPPVIGILGMGVMGRAAANAFRALDFPVLGWSRSGRGPDDVERLSGCGGLAGIAARSDYLICLLPLTPATRGILDRSLFERMADDSTLINVGRGSHLVETDLVEALDRGRPAHAILDVFATEPLPAEHPFWDHPAVTITPHCASITLTREAAELALESYRRVRAGRPPLGLVDRASGY